MTNHGVVDDVSISMEDYNVVEMFLELISVPILLASMLVSVALVYWHDEAKVSIRANEYVCVCVCLESRFGFSL